MDNTDINLRMNAFIDGKLVPEFDLDDSKLTEVIEGKKEYLNLSLSEMVPVTIDYLELPNK